jgi:O-antigen/teichoic acid export membrane protein
MRTTLARGVAHFSYTPALAFAAAVTLGKLIVYAGLIDVGQFGLLGKMLLVSAAFGVAGSLGMQSVASRDVPALFARGRDRRGLRSLAQTLAVTTVVAVAASLVAASGAAPLGLRPAEFVLSLLHGWAQSAFLTATFESRSRLEMNRYARDTAVRSVLTALAGILAAAAGWGGTGILVSEFAVTLLSFAVVAARAVGRTQFGARLLALSVLRRGWRLPWRAALVMLAGIIVAFVSSNLDRWIAAEHLERTAFGQYAFAWLTLVAAQSAQALLNSGLLPLLARRRAQSLEASAFRLTRLLSLSLLVGGLVLAWPLTSALSLTVDHALPKYGDALDLVAPMLLAAVLRLSDFWSSLLIVLEREGTVLAGQVIAVAAAGAGFVLWMSGTESPLTARSLAWLAFATALMSYLASLAGVCAVAAARRRRLTAAC